MITKKIFSRTDNQFSSIYLTYNKFLEAQLPASGTQCPYSIRNTCFYHIWDMVSFQHPGHGVPPAFITGCPNSSQDMVSLRYPYGVSTVSGTQCSHGIQYTVSLRHPGHVLLPLPGHNVPTAYVTCCPHGILETVSLQCAG